MVLDVVSVYRKLIEIGMASLNTDPVALVVDSLLRDRLVLDLTLSRVMCKYCREVLY